MKDLDMMAWRCGRMKMESPWTKEVCNRDSKEVEDDGL